MPEQLPRFILLIAIACLGQVVAERIDPKLGTLYVLIVLGGVALSQRQGVAALTSFILQETQKGV